MAGGLRVLIGALLAASGFAQAQTFPQTEISNGLVNAKVLLPDAERGYYRGVRFDWSGLVESLTYKGHEFFGQWFARYDPLLHDAIMGPVEEFRSADGALGYAEAKPRGMFMKIGVGILRKLDDEPYNFARSYTLLNPGRRVVRVEKDRVEFTHELSDGEGRAYEYKKTLLLPRGKPQLVLEHSFKNTGKRMIETDIYNHDFFMLDQQPTGPDVSAEFKFLPKPKEDWSGPARVDGNKIVYARELKAGESAAGELAGFGQSTQDNDVRVVNAAAGIGVRERTDKPVSKLYFWSVRTTVCPEIYIRMHVEPGYTFKWRTTYDFYLISR